MVDRKKAIHYLAYGIFALFGLLFLPFWKPIICAGIFALALKPWLVKATAREIPQSKVLTTTALTTLLIILPFILGMYYTSAQIVRYSKNTEQSQMLKPNNLTHIFSSKANELFEKAGIEASETTRGLTERMSSSIGEYLLSISSMMITEIPEVILSIIIFTLALYVFLSYQSYFKDQILKWKILTKKDLNELIKVLQAGATQCLLSLLIVGFVQSSTVVIGAAIAGFSALLFIFLLTFVCSFIPIIGAAPVAFGLALWKILDGEIGLGVVLIITGCIAGTIDNVLKPLLVKRGIKMDGTITLISIIGAIIIFGIPGLLIGPLLASTSAYYFHRGDKEDQINADKSSV